MNIQELQILSPSRMSFSTADQLKQYVFSRSERFFDEGDKARAAINSPEELSARREYIRSAFLKSIGGLPETDCALDPIITGTVEGKGFRVEKIVFQSRPHVYVTCNLYLPDGLKRPSGAVLMVLGHGPESKADSDYQAVIQCMVHAGLIVLAMDPTGQGERYNYWNNKTHRAVVHPTVADHEYAGARMIADGRSAARYFLLDAMRAIDYLLTRPEVDAAKIGVTGSSGGGTQTTMLMMTDSRIAAAAPATFLTNRKEYMHLGGGQDAEQIWPGFSAAGLNHEDMLLAMAPRPVMVLAARYDFFVLDGTLRTIENARRFYAMLEKEENLQLTIDDVPHHYSLPLACAAGAFFSKHLNGKILNEIETKALANGIEAFPCEALNCTKSAQVTIDYPDALTLAAEMRKYHNEQTSPVTKEEAAEWLRSRVYNNRPDSPLRLRILTEQVYCEMNVQAVAWWTQRDMANYGLLFRKEDYAVQKLPLTVSLWDGGTQCLQPHVDWIRDNCNLGRAVLVLDITAMGNLSPAPFLGYPIDIPFGVMHKLCTDMFFIGDSLAALRTYDLMKVADAAREMPDIDSNDISYYFSGTMAFYGKYAALLDERIAQGTFENCPPDMETIFRADFYDDYMFPQRVIPGMLRHGVH